MMDTADRPPLPLFFQIFSPNSKYSKYTPLMLAASTTTLVDDVGGGSGECVELRSRNSNKNLISSNGGGPWRPETTTPSSTSSSGCKAALMEHTVKSGETLMQISLHYSVPVNNIVADQEIHGLPTVRVPVSRAFLLRRQLAEEAATKDGQIIDLLGDEVGEEGTSGEAKQQQMSSNNQQQSLHHQHQLIDLRDPRQKKDATAASSFGGSNESLAASGGRAREVIEGILDETDRNMAAVRQQLPAAASAGLEGGAFHFVDAGAPDNNSSNVWLIVAVVLIIFVLIPLALTFLEESDELEAGRHHRQQQQQI